jgi:hypothetical protein
MMRDGNLDTSHYRVAPILGKFVLPPHWGCCLPDLGPCVIGASFSCESQSLRTLPIRSPKLIAPSGHFVLPDDLVGAGE